VVSKNIGESDRYVRLKNLSRTRGAEGWVLRGAGRLASRGGGGVWGGVGGGGGINRERRRGGEDGSLCNRGGDGKGGARR